MLQLDLEKHEKSDAHEHIIVITNDPKVDLFSHEIKKAEVGEHPLRTIGWKNGLMSEIIIMLTAIFFSES